MTNIDRRLARLEQSAPFRLMRPAGLSGESLVIHVITELCSNVDERTDQEQAQLQSACLGLMTHDELHICATLLRASMAAGPTSEPASIPSGRTA